MTVTPKATESVKVQSRAMGLHTVVSMAIAGVSSFWPAIVKLLPDIRMGAANEWGCRYQGGKKQGPRSDKGRREIKNRAHSIALGQGEGEGCGRRNDESRRRVHWGCAGV